MAKHGPECATTDTAEKAVSRDLWTISDFCQAHGFSRAYAYELLQREVLVAVKVGKLTLITEASRQAWLQSLPRFRSTAAVRNPEQKHAA